MKAIKGLFGGGKSKQKGDPGPNLMSADSPSGSRDEGNSGRAEQQSPSKVRGGENAQANAPSKAASSATKQPQQQAVSAEVMDERLEVAINSTMDFLANEGLEVPNLFRAVAPSREVESVMGIVRAGKEYDFIAANDAPITVGVLKMCIAEKSTAVFPTSLLESLAAIIKEHRHSPQDRISRLQKLLQGSVATGVVSALFLNLLGLLNLVNQHSALNGTQVQPLNHPKSPHPRTLLSHRSAWNFTRALKSSGNPPRSRDSPPARPLSKP